jgi:hypothetical protein
MPELNWLNWWSSLVFLYTIWIIRRRFTMPPEWNRALYYYLGLVFYARSYEGILNNNIVFGAVVLALFIRFEFLGKQVLGALRFLEFLVHSYVLWITFQVIFFMR